MDRFVNKSEKPGIGGNFRSRGMLLHYSVVTFSLKWSKISGP